MTDPKLLGWRSDQGEVVMYDNSSDPDFDCDPKTGRPMPAIFDVVHCTACGNKQANIPAGQTCCTCALKGIGK